MNEVSYCSYQDPLLQHSKNNYIKSLYNVVISIWNWKKNEANLLKFHSTDR